METNKFISTKVVELGSCAFRQPRHDGHCSFIHGYRLQAKIWIQASSLDHRNWVYDFGGFKEIKKELHKQFDHTTCIDKADPFLHKFQELHDLGLIDLRVMDGVGIEKFAQFVYNYVNNHIKLETNGRCWVIRVEVWEHEQNSAICEGLDYMTTGYIVDDNAQSYVTVQQLLTVEGSTTSPTQVHDSNVVVFPPQVAPPQVAPPQVALNEEAPAPKPQVSVIVTPTGPKKPKNLGYKEMFDNLNWGAVRKK